MGAIVDIRAREILDSRGNPTVEVDVILESGISGRASVPSGSSKGTQEAVERRDGKSRYDGQGVMDAVTAVNEEVFPVLSGMESSNQVHLDKTLIELDGTRNKARIGANAILGVSLAISKASAMELEQPLFRYVGGVTAGLLPVPMINILNGGAHADNALDFQEFMIMPTSAKSIAEAVCVGTDIFRNLRLQLSDSGYSVNVGDEGGFAPAIDKTINALDFVMRAIEGAGYLPGEEVCIALDVAASELYSDGKYILNGEKRTMDTSELIGYYEELIARYPIISIEDGLDEEDWPGWRQMTASLGNTVQIVGDDLFVTNADRLKRGIAEASANAILIKVNQIGTLTEALEATELAHKSGFSAVMSHRSGETEDTTIADLAVATGCGQIKAGSITRTDRTAKYNQLIRIEETLQPRSLYAGLSVIRGRELN